MLDRRKETRISVRSCYRPEDRRNGTPANKHRFMGCPAVVPPPGKWTARNPHDHRTSWNKHTASLCLRPPPSYDVRHVSFESSAAARRHPVAPTSRAGYCLNLILILDKVSEYYDAASLPTRKHKRNKLSNLFINLPRRRRLTGVARQEWIDYGRLW